MRPTSCTGLAVVRNGIAWMRCGPANGKPTKLLVATACAVSPARLGMGASVEAKSTSRNLMAPRW